VPIQRGVPEAGSSCNGRDAWREKWQQAVETFGGVTVFDFPDCGHVVVRPWPPGQAPPMPFDNGGTHDALDAAHAVALPAVVTHLRAGD